MPGRPAPSGDSARLVTLNRQLATVEAETGASRQCKGQGRVARAGSSTCWAVPRLTAVGDCAESTGINEREPMLEIKNLHVRIEEEGTEIIRGLNLTVKSGEVAAIMGPNGSGKSTLSYALSGRDGYEVTEGEILFNGVDILEMAPDERAAAGRVPRFPVSGGNPRRRHDELPQGGDEFAAQGARRGRIDDAGLHPHGQGSGRQTRHIAWTCSSARSMSAFPAARRSAPKSCRWHCCSRSFASWTRPIPASTSTR